MKMRFFAVVATASLIAAFSISCHKDRNKELGSTKNPLKISFMPSAEKTVMDENAKIATGRFEALSGLKSEPLVSDNFFNVVDGLATKRIDVAFMNSLGYLLAHDWSGAEAIMQFKGVDGKADYRSAIIVHRDSDIKKIADLNGKSVVFTDPFSMSGYLMPLALFTEKGVKPRSTSFAKTFEEVVKMIYNREADAGAIYYHKRDPYGRVNDAREKLVPTYEDLLEKVVVLELTDTIPNTPVVVRKDIPPEIKANIVQAFSKMSDDPETIAAIGKMYDAKGFSPANEENFNKIRTTLKKLGKEVKEVVPGGVTFYQKHIWAEAPTP